MTFSIFLGRIVLNIRDATTVQNTSMAVQGIETEGGRSTFLLGDSVAEIPVLLDIELSDFARSDPDPFEWLHEG